MTNEELFPELLGPPPKMIRGDDVVTRGTLRSWATFSTDEVYRYLLGRFWHPETQIMVCGMLNPSTADENVLDPTIKRVVKFAKRYGFGGIIIWNAFALRSTDPKALLTHHDPIGPRNIEAIQNSVDLPLLSETVLAWGKPPSRKLCDHVRKVEVIIRSCRRHLLWQFGPSTKDGFPRHPLYLRGDTPIIRRTQ